MKEKDCGSEIKEVERKFDMCLDVSRSILSLSIFFFLLQFSIFYTFVFKDRIASEYSRLSFISNHGIKADKLKNVFKMHSSFDLFQSTLSRLTRKQDKKASTTRSPSRKRSFNLTNSHNQGGTYRIANSEKKVIDEFLK